jgi:outer membrane protein
MASWVNLEFHEECIKMGQKIGLLLVLIVGLLSSSLFAAEPTTHSTTSVEILSLENCLELAYKNSNQLQTAAKNIQLAQNSVMEASGGFWPTVGYHYQYLNESENSSMSFPSDPYLGDFMDMMNMIENNGYTGTVYLNQPLYTGGKLTSLRKLAQLKLASAVEEERKDKQQLNYNVKEAYYNCWLAEKTLEVTEDSCDNMARHYQKVNNLLNVGTASQYDLLQIKVQWENQKILLIKAKRGLASTKVKLATLISLEKNRDFQVEYDSSKLQLPETVNLTPQTLLDEAYRKRPEMHQIQLTAESAKANEKLARSGYLPSLSLSYDYIYYSPSDLKLADNSTNIATLTVGLSGLLFDGYTTKAKIMEANNNLDLAKIAEGTLKDQISQEMDLTLQSLEENLETIHGEQANVELAKKSLNMTEGRYTVGAATITDVTDSQVALEQTFNDYYQGISLYLIDLAKIDLITGRDVL